MEKCRNKGLTYLTKIANQDPENKMLGKIEKYYYILYFAFISLDVCIPRNLSAICRQIGDVVSLIEKGMTNQNA